MKVASLWAREPINLGTLVTNIPELLRGLGLPKPLYYLDPSSYEFGFKA